MPATAPSLRDRLTGRLVGARLSAEDEARFQEERRQRNRRNARGTVIALVPVHLLVAILYWPAGGPFAAVPEFDATVSMLHLAAVPIGIGLASVAVYAEPRWPPGWRGAASLLFQLVYVLLATGLSINAQRHSGNINVFTIAILGVTILFSQRAWETLLILGTALAALTIGVLWFHSSRELRLMALTPAVGVTMLSFLIARINIVAARAELVARLTIQRQAAELEALNRDLELRVRVQVDEIVVRAAEIDRLNHHLRAQVIDRSRQLAHALLALGPRTHAALAIGDTLDGRVEIRGALGSGAMGDVYRGADRILGRDVAVKVLRPDSGVSSDVWVRFAAEAEAAAAVHHPCVVPTLHVGITDDGRLYQLQELVEGETLTATLTRGRWEAASAARIGARVADALAAAHAAGIVHRDVKPSNVMLTTRAPGIHLLDFGISKVHDSDGTAANDVVGTPMYMSPEQIADPSAVGPAADVYALGVVLHELIAGAPPFSGSTMALLDHHVHRAPPRLDDALAPATLSALVLRCLAKEPSARPGALALAQELLAFADAAGAPPAEALPRPAGADRTVRLR